MKQWVAEGKGDPSRNITKQSHRGKDDQRETAHAGMAEGF